MREEGVLLAGEFVSVPSELVNESPDLSVPQMCCLFVCLSLFFFFKKCG